jgi:hypothetical protein
MSVCYYWFACFLDARAHERVLPDFQAAQRASGLSDQARHALEAWRADPTRFAHRVEHYDPAWGEAFNAFIAAFNVPGFLELAHQFCRAEGKFGDYLSEDTVFRFVILRRCTPCAALWQALGPERAAQLPGVLGNLLLDPSEVKPALAQVESVYAAYSTDELVEQALPLVDHSNEAKTLEETITLMPEALRRAHAVQRGLLILSCPQL